MYNRISVFTAAEKDEKESFTGIFFNILKSFIKKLKKTYQN